MLVSLGILIALFFSFCAFSPGWREMVYSYREEALLGKLIKSTGGIYQSASITGWVRLEGEA
ncbi:MAG: hypothetical protein RQM92_16775 [Candidatus Syntrophopropionicum ammoniitolerans]